MLQKHSQADFTFANLIFNVNSGLRPTLGDANLPLQSSAAVACVSEINALQGCVLWSAGVHRQVQVQCQTRFLGPIQNQSY